MIPITPYPGLASLCWNRPHTTHITARDALNLYEANWRHLDASGIPHAERDLIRHLIATEGRGCSIIPAHLYHPIQDAP